MPKKFIGPLREYAGFGLETHESSLRGKSVVILSADKKGDRYRICPLSLFSKNYLFLNDTLRHDHNNQFPEIPDGKRSVPSRHQCYRKSRWPEMPCQHLSASVAFMVTVPVLTPVASPLFFLGTLMTVATAVFEEVQVRFTEWSDPA